MDTVVLYCFVIYNVVTLIRFYGKSILSSIVYGYFCFILFSNLFSMTHANLILSCSCKSLPWAREITLSNNVR